MITVICYSIYIILSIAITVWVARTLHANGRAFLIDAFQNNTALADSVNHLLVVGFYLINLGYMSWVLKLDMHPEDIASAIELMSSKLGLVLMVIGCMHFGNIFIFSQIRKNALLNSFFNNEGK
jgi:TRAP-type C4-dicarboxylate transport system permease large subunit